MGGIGKGEKGGKRKGGEVNRSGRSGDRARIRDRV